MAFIHACMIKTVPSQHHIHAQPKAHDSDLNPDLLYLSLPRVLTAQHSLYRELQKTFCLKGETGITHFPGGDKDIFLDQMTKLEIIFCFQCNIPTTSTS